MANTTENIKLIISEVDGVLTDGLIPYDALGNVPFKNFNPVEFDYVNKLKKYFDVVFMSRDASISHTLLRQKNMPFFWAKKSKLETLKHIMLRYSVTPDEVIYIDTSMSDMECINLVPYSVLASATGNSFCLLYDTDLQQEIIRRNRCS